MSEKDIPAFPTRILDNNGDFTDIDGMTLRDYMAGQALSGLVTYKHLNESECAEIAYKQADAMLEARGDE